MKIKHAITAFTFALVAGLGTIGALNLNKQVEVKEASAGTISGGNEVFLRASNSYWNQDGSIFAIYTWGKESGASYTSLTSVSDSNASGYAVYKATIPAGDTSIIFVRYSPGSTMTDWSGRQNQSNDFTLSDSTSNLWINSSWGKDNNGNGTDWGGNWASGTYSETATSKSKTIYASSADYETNEVPNAYVWGSGLVSPTTSYPGSAMTTTATKTTMFLGSVLYKQTINYQTHMSDESDVSIQMILNNDGDKNKSPNIGFSDIKDGYYYSPTGGKFWYSGADKDANKGADAALAFELGTVDICNLSKTDADDLRDAMEANKGHITSATWNGYSYTEAYNLVNSKCTTPKASLSQVTFGINTASQDSIFTLIIVASALSILALGGFFFIKKRKEN